MIQRIQSFWLVLAACCIALCFMFPIAQYRFDLPETGQQVEAQLDLLAKSNPEMMNQILGGEPVVKYSQRDSGFQTWPVMALAALVGVAALVCIFLYRNRVRQMRLVAVTFLLNVVYVFLIFFWAVDAYSRNLMQYFHVDSQQVTWYVGAYAPIVSIVLLVLAHRGIKRDEAKVRAADRLR